ncbi:hypothetical protein [Buchnera aphidicola]|uniref:hypothetical protein n=1 Tax=Buchnera aphidicola TaxID=9 RepID=UPI002542DC67|nr:hypothetical protein [Buchnera aphidicola]WII23590.1 hypothetical protein QCB51_01700 [Buchnera aphidicola (Sipha maydis)]
MNSNIFQKLQKNFFIKILFILISIVCIANIPAVKKYLSKEYKNFFSASNVEKIIKNEVNKTPDHKKPNQKTPEHKTPDHHHPEHKTPDHHHPEHKTPDHHHPEHKTPDHHHPEHKTPDHHQPEPIYTYKYRLHSQYPCCKKIS